VTRFGIALPAWIIDKAYSYWVCNMVIPRQTFESHCSNFPTSFKVLGLYFLIFMVIMPTIVVSIACVKYRNFIANCLSFMLSGRLVVPIDKIQR